VPIVDVNRGQETTKKALLRRLFGKPSTAEELAQAMGIDPTVARRHLVDLRNAGFVTVDLERGSVGRPRARYALTVEGREVFFAKYDVVLDALTRGALRRNGPRHARSLYREAARTLGADLGYPRSTGETMRTLQEVGFEPELRTEQGRRLMVSHNCPVLRQARKTPPLLCEAFHGELLDRAFRGSHASLRQTMATGAPECIHLLAPSNVLQRSSEDQE